jgi:uncharacterized membrane protein
MVAPLDFLDIMAWDVALSAILIGIGTLMLPYKAQEGCADEKARGMRVGFAVATGAAGFYLFLSGCIISFTWPLAMTGGVYNILFGGIATFGGIVLLAGSIALYVNANLKPITYAAAVAGVLALVDAYAIVYYNLTSSPLTSALAYLSFAAPAILSVPAAQFSSKRWRLGFALFAFLFAAAWLFEAANFTFAHLKPP